MKKLKVDQVEINTELMQTLAILVKRKREIKNNKNQKKKNHHKQNSMMIY